MIRRLVVAIAALSLATVVAHADTGFESVASSFQPRVPVSLLGSFGSIASRFDPSRFHMSSTITVGSGSGYGTSALQTTAFSYQFRAPLAMSVSVGNAFGAGTGTNSKMFLQGVDLRYQPSANSVLRVQYQNVRSPLQYGYGYAPGYAYGPDRPFAGQ